MEEGIFFTSHLFEIKKGEDEKTNPLCYGKSLAEWLCFKFGELGYDTEVIPEDWGWCVMCDHGDYSLWLGCGLVKDEELYESYDKNNPPNGSDVIWHVFPAIEIPFFGLKSQIRKWSGGLDLDRPLKKLDSELNQLMSSERRITICKQPQV